MNLAQLLAVTERTERRHVVAFLDEDIDVGRGGRVPHRVRAQLVRWPAEGRPQPRDGRGWLDFVLIRTLFLVRRLFYGRKS